MCNFPDTCLFRSNRQRRSTKKADLKNFAIFTGKDLCWSLFSCKYCIIFKKTYFEKHLQTTVYGFHFINLPLFVFIVHSLFKRQFHKIVKHTQTIRWQIADELFELFECVWPFKITPFFTNFISYAKHLELDTDNSNTFL